MRQVVLIYVFAGWLPWLTNSSSLGCACIGFDWIDFCLVALFLVVEVTKYPSYVVFVFLLAHLFGKYAAAKELSTCTRSQGLLMRGS